MSEVLHRLSDEGEAAFARNASERITYWNRKCEEILGVPARCALGRHCHDVVGGHDAYGNLHCVHNCRIAFQARNRLDPVHEFPLAVPTKEGQKRFLVKVLAIPSYHPSLSTLIHVLREDGQTPLRRPPLATGPSAALTEPLRPISDRSDQLAVLTRREREILRLLSHGLATPEIATRLSISPATVRNHIAALLQRMNVHSKLAAVALAYRRKLL